MCDHDNREATMVVLQPHTDASRGVWCDPCLAPLVKALNDGGLATVASCCGHGRQPGNVALADGRELIIAPDFDTAREVDRAFPHSRGRGDPVDVRWQGVGST